MYDFVIIIKIIYEIKHSERAPYEINLSLSLVLSNAQVTSALLLLNVSYQSKNNKNVLKTRINAFFLICRTMTSVECSNETDIFVGRKVFLLEQLSLPHHKDIPTMSDPRVSLI